MNPSQNPHLLHLLGIMPAFTCSHLLSGKAWGTSWMTRWVSSAPHGEDKSILKMLKQECSQQVERDGFPSSFQHCWNCICHVVSCFVILLGKNTDISRWWLRCLEDCSTSHARSGSANYFLQSLEGKDKGSCCISIYWKGRFRKDGAKMLLEVQCDWMRSSGRKLQYMKY